MWSLLNGTLSPLSWRGIVPADAEIVLQNRLPALIGVGFTSIGLEVCLQACGERRCSR